MGEIEGEVMAFDDNRVTAFQIDALTHGDADNLWRVPVTRGGGLVTTWMDPDEDPVWTFELEEPAQVESMLANEELIFIAGPKTRSEPMETGFLKILSSADGSLINGMDLETAPVHEGLAAANGEVIAVLRDGSILCYGN